MEKFLLTSIVILLIIVFLLFFHLISLKKHIQRFAQELNKLVEFDYNQLLKVDTFNKDLVNLANSLNVLAAHQNDLKKKYFDDKKELTNVIAGISHDFRTPLTSAKGYLQLLRKKSSFDDNEKEYLDIVNNKIDYLKLLSDDFFEISTLKAKDEIELKSVNLSNIIAEVILSQNDWIEKNDIKTQINIPDNTITIISDEHNLSRILVNIFSNAKKYTKSWLKITLTKNLDCVLLSISNDVYKGISIDEEKIFEPFYRDNARSMEGSGLGLYIVKCLSNKLNIFVDSKYTIQPDENIFSISLKINK